MELLEFIQTFDLWFAIIAFFLIIADVVSGIMKGYATHTISSEKMRLGFWHKSANMFLLLLSYSATMANNIIADLPSWTSGVYVFAASYISIMELTSILENLADINPALKANILFERFGIVKSKDDETPEE